jgi:putative protein-disulfide isomerase
MPDSTELVYVHDPMCSWCWGFRPTLTSLCSQLPEGVAFRRLLGGLAPDSDQPMPAAMQEKLQHTWRRIQERIPGTEFNFDFWDTCVPRRSTYPACRAVIAARMLEAAREDAMILAIQQAYYLRAMNPSDIDTLVQLAGETELDAEKFAFLLTRDFVDEQLQCEIGEARAMRATSFPALVLKFNYANYWTVPIDYTDTRPMLNTIETLIAQRTQNSAP